MTLSNAAESAVLQGVAITPRTLHDYRDMFLLSDDDIRTGRILDCPGGASPFAAQVRAAGGTVVSVDPAYRLPLGPLITRATDGLDRILAWQLAHPDNFDWGYLGSPQQLNDRWREAVQAFAADVAHDPSPYIAAELPDLPFGDDSFDLTLSGFLLFVYPELFDIDGLLRSLLELVRVTRGQVRVYPVHDTVGTGYPLLPELRRALAAAGVGTQLVATGTTYSPEPGSDRMLVCERLPRGTD